MADLGRGRDRSRPRPGPRDVVLPGRVVLTSLLLAAPLGLSLVRGPAEVALVGAVSAMLAAAAPLWSSHFGQAGFWVPLAVVVFGSAGATLSARLLTRLRKVTRDLTGAERRLQATSTRP